MRRRVSKSGDWKKRQRLFRFWRWFFLDGSWFSCIRYADGRVIKLNMGHDKWHTSFCADPFLFRYKGANWLFYETLDRSGKGVLGCFKEIGGRWIQQGKVLERNCHLSYPQVFEENGKVYMIPESFDEGRGTVDLYEAVEFPFKWNRVKTLLPIPSVDTTLYRKNGSYYLFSLVEVGQNPCAALWHADSLTGEWRRHPESDHVNQSCRLRRCGGSFVEESGKLYRICQDCNGGYGKRIFRVAVDAISPQHYKEGGMELVLNGSYGCHHSGQHTYNRIGVDNGWLETFDVHVYKLRSIGSMINILAGILKKRFKR